LSSNTDPRQRGQTLVLFTLTLVALLIAAALVFDVGQSLADRRSQQDAADAAALAGARYLPTSTAQARAVALDIAAQNGYRDGVGGMTVEVKIPPGPETNFAGRNGFIEVRISGSRGSFFGGITSMPAWNVSALAVAANTHGAAAPYAFLALDPDGCQSAKFTGNATVTVNGNIQVNSSCSSAMMVQGNADVTVTTPDGQCNVHGDIKMGGHADLNCIKNPGAAVVPDPLATLAPPAVPGLPASVVEVGGTLPIPDNCPGGANPATTASPGPCKFTSSYDGTVWRLSPGLYPGGIVVQGGIILLQPGIYYLGGGGFQANGTSAKVYSVDAGATSPVLGGGVLLFNSEDPDFHTACASHPGQAGCIGDITFNGSSTEVHLRQLDIPAPSPGWRYNGLVIWQDGSIANQPTITIDGSGATMDVTGTMYAPKALLQINGDAGDTITTQVIAYDFVVNGTAGTFNVNYDEDYLFQFHDEGLVQ
jgi:Flp pilus assembly protein TadG